MTSNQEADNSVRDVEQFSGEPQLIHLSNDQAHNDSRRRPYWHEMAILDSADGSRVVHITRRSQVDNTQPFEGSRPYNGNQHVESDLQIDFGLIADICAVKSLDVQDAMHTLGYDLREGINSYLVTYLSPEAKNRRLDWIRGVTGYASRVLIGGEGLYTYPELADALDLGAVLVSASPEDEEHDSINHALAWDLLAESSFVRIAHRSREVVDNYQATFAEEGFKEHFRRIETGIGRRYVQNIGNYINPTSPEVQQRALGRLRRLFRNTMFGDSYDAQTHDAIIDEEINTCADHVRLIASLRDFLPN